ncbi:glycosylhydrolase-like jelly roll fold domain-containing protein [Cohnella thailandensis]|uniref:Glycosyl hydrolases family 2 sugar binding domain-containing protein n=1 Tax=Cohnella thailandensis TaxID=557557 RepID=A0A841T3J3_9BACL|nr:glycosylhydrolase-like jelly roll fold domain-containing protein [Cohnella thailandensis]MBB6637195.1 hypothetical protein [Cohnella thailandensis]MBP1976983.1 hypothetical protein [Cohnella thailandensis]
MDKLIQEAVTGKHLHYQQPFFRVSEKDTEESLRRRIKQFNEHGYYSIVLEYNRTDGSISKTTKFDDDWWERLGYISEACKELGMTFWMQDAAPFPTGSANGSFEEEEHRSKSKKFIVEKHLDIHGPIHEACIPIDKLASSIRGNLKEILQNRSDIPDKLLYVTAVRKSVDAAGYDSESRIDLTSRVKDGVLRFDFGPGIWRVFAILETYGGGRKHFMNLLDEESVRVQIDSVHAPHYERLKEQLGVTWMGFFYDEPEIGNLGGYVFDNLPGRSHNAMSVPLPWNKDMPQLLEQRFGPDFPTLLPSLWCDFEGTSPFVRHAYMDTITRLIAKNYNGQVFQWCEERGIAYIGHVIEDENAHSRLGSGPGHFFRVEEGQHIAGIDVVGGQIWPGMDFEGMSWYGALEGDGEFYHYGLAKLGSSAGHLDPKKQGRSLCEFIGLYGTLAGTRIRKFVIDHLLVNGINNFIPAEDGIDLDPVFSRKLNAYTDRMCHVLRDGEHVAPVAVLYHAEAEWSGEFQYFHKPGKALATNQIDYDVVPTDVFARREEFGTRLQGGRLLIHKESYQALIIPYSQRIPKEVASFIQEAESAGFPVYFVDRHPEGFCETANEAMPAQVYSCKAVPLDSLAATLREDGIYEISVSNPQPYLRYLHYRRDDVDLILFHNEEPVKEIETVVTIPTTKPVRVYDVMENRIYAPKAAEAGGNTQIPLKLGQYEAILFMVGENIETITAPDMDDAKELSGRWEVSFESLDSSPAPEIWISDELDDIGSSDRYPDFYGKATYRTTFTSDSKLPKYLSLGKVSECAEVYVNDQYLGAAVAEPYRFSLGDSVQEGTNRLEIVVTNNRTRSKDAGKGNHPLLGSLSAVTYNWLEPCGLLGPVKLMM